MTKTYQYNSETYADESALRKAIFEKDRVVFGPEPDTGKSEFWASFGVVYREADDPEPSLEKLKEQKRKELDRAFYRWRNSEATLISSLGFVADADQRAMIDIAGLVALEAPAVFMDANNQPHELSVEQIKTLQREIIQSSNDAYQNKWTLRSLIEGASDAATLQAIEIAFLPKIFSRADT